MTTWDDKWATPQARDYQRGLLADEIARAAIYRAIHKRITYREHGEGIFNWVQGRYRQWNDLVTYAETLLANKPRGYLDARRP